jgi:hypothetical protein
MKHTIWKTVAGVSAAVGLSVAATSAASAAVPAAPAHTPTWHEIGTGAITGVSDITAVVATGKTSGWVFGGLVTYQRTGANVWKKVAFSHREGEISVVGAASSTDVWAFDNTPYGSVAYTWNGTKWSAAKTFRGWVGGVSVLARNDVWVFGAPYPDGQTGVWHYNGHGWSQVAANLYGGSALSDKNVWAYSGTTIAHFNGAKWTTVDVARLLPAKAKNGLRTPPHVDDVIALSARDVYALGVGNTSAVDGPLVVLHYNGSTWNKVAEGPYPNAAAASPDGTGGLWIAIGHTGGSVIAHYEAGKLSLVSLPGSAVQPVNVIDIARIPGTTEQLAGGWVPAMDGKPVTYGVVLQYS